VVSRVPSGYLTRRNAQRATEPSPHHNLIKMGSIGIPIKLLNEAQGHVCTLELTSGQIFRGKLIEGNYLVPPPSSSEEEED
jgi:hypothetical protein